MSNHDNRVVPQTGSRSQEMTSMFPPRVYFFLFCTHCWTALQSRFMPRFVPDHAPLGMTAETVWCHVCSWQISSDFFEKCHFFKA